MRMVGIFGWTARSGVSTMPATLAYRSACDEYSPRQQSIFYPLLTSALPVTKERFFSSKLRANPHIAGHKPSVLGRNPGDLEVDELPVTHCLWRWTKHSEGNSWLKTSTTRPLPFSAQSTAATVCALRLMNSQAPEAKTISGKYPMSRDTIHSDCLAKRQTHQTGRETLDVYSVDRSARLLKIGNEHPTASTNYTLQQVQDQPFALYTTCFKPATHDSASSRNSETERIIVEQVKSSLPSVSDDRNFATMYTPESTKATSFTMYSSNSHPSQVSSRYDPTRYC